MALVDFHCHLDLYPDHGEAVRQAEADQVFTLAVTTTPRAWARNHELASATKHVRAALGLHPQLVAEREHEIELWKSLLPRSRYVGEVGLDAGPRFYKSLDRQKVVFAEVLRCCATAGDKILTLHSVRATATVLDMIEEILPRARGRVVLHWFTGSQAELRRAAALGCYFSVNAAMLANNQRQKITKPIPLDRLLTETDGPFTTISGRPARPSDVGATCSELGQLHGMSSERMEQTVRANLKVLLR